MKVKAIRIIRDQYQCQILIVYYMSIFYWKTLRIYFNLAKINLDIEEQHLVKHSSFVINEKRHYMVKRCSPCFIVNLDMKKAFDKLWRHCLFYKLLNQIDNSYWRAIVNYFENSRGKIKIDAQSLISSKISLRSLMRIIDIFMRIN